MTISKYSLHKNYIILMVVVGYSIALLSNIQIYKLEQDAVRAEAQIQRLESLIQLQALKTTMLDRGSLLVAIQRQSEPEYKQFSVKDYIKEKFGKDAKLALAVFTAESHLNPQAVGDKHLTYNKDGKEYGASYGVTQIRHLPGRPTPEKLLDPKFNIDYAYTLYEKQGFKPWSAYVNKSYKKFL